MRKTAAVIFIFAPCSLAIEAPQPQRGQGDKGRGRQGESSSLPLVSLSPCLLVSLLYVSAVAAVADRDQNSPRFLNFSLTFSPNLRFAASSLATTSSSGSPADSRAAGISVWHSFVSIKRAASSNGASSSSGTTRKPCLSAWINCPGLTRRPKTSTSPPQRTGHEYA